MCFDDAELASGIGKIVTSPGLSLVVSEEYEKSNEDTTSCFAFSAKGDSTVVLLTSGEEFGNKVTERRRIITDDILQGYKNPNKIIQMLTSSVNYQDSVLKNIEIDSGTAFFEDKLFCGNVGESFSKPPFSSSVNSWRRICSPLLFNKQHRSLLTTILYSSPLTSQDVINFYRKRLVADAISFLVTLAVQLLYTTNGLLTFIPDGYNISIVEEKSTYEVHPKNFKLVVNDPSGNGWRIINPILSKEFEKSIKEENNLETLIEFCFKGLSNSILYGMDLNHMRNIIKSTQNNVNTWKPFKSSYKKTDISSSTTDSVNNKNCLITMHTFGFSNIRGIGNLPRSDQEGLPIQYTKEFCVNVKLGPSPKLHVSPRPYVNDLVDHHQELEYNNIWSPPILSWLNIENLLMPTLSTGVSDGVDNNIEESDIRITNHRHYYYSYYWILHCPVLKMTKYLEGERNSVTSTKKWRSCQIDDGVLKDSLDFWSNWKYKMKKLDKFELTAPTRPWKLFFDKLSAVIAIMTHQLDGIRENRCAYDPIPITSLVETKTLVTDVYGFENDVQKGKPVILLTKISEPLTEKQRTEREEWYILTIIGNSPNGQSLRAIRISKRKSYEKDETKQTANEENYDACEWVTTMPSSIVSIPTECNQRPHYSDTHLHQQEEKSSYIFLFTPRCIHHDINSSVHLYSHNIGHTDSIYYFNNHLVVNSKKSDLQDALQLDDPFEIITSEIEHPLAVAMIGASGICYSNNNNNNNEYDFKNVIKLNENDIILPINNLCHNNNSLITNSTISPPIKRKKY